MGSIVWAMVLDMEDVAHEIYIHTTEYAASVSL